MKYEIVELGTDGKDRWVVVWPGTHDAKGKRSGLMIIYTDTTGLVLGQTVRLSVVA